MAADVPDPRGDERFGLLDDFFTQSEFVRVASERAVYDGAICRFRHVVIVGEDVFFGGDFEIVASKTDVLRVCVLVVEIHFSCGRHADVHIAVPLRDVSAVFERVRFDGMLDHLRFTVAPIVVVADDGFGVDDVIDFARVGGEIAISVVRALGDDVA